MSTDVVEQGDVVWLRPDPYRAGVGHEQAKHRPHLVLSSRRAHDRTGVVIAVPLTSAHRPWATRVEVEPGSFAISEQPRSFSVERIEEVSSSGHDTAAVVAALNRLIKPI